MVEGFKKVTFTEALRVWDRTDNQKVICIYTGEKTEFPMNCKWRTNFEVNGGMILDGEWYVEIIPVDIKENSKINEKGEN